MPGGLARCHLCEFHILMTSAEVACGVNWEYVRTHGRRVGRAGEYDSCRRELMSLRI